MTEQDAKIERLELDNKALEGQLEKIKRLHNFYKNVLTESQKKLVVRLVTKDDLRSAKGGSNSRFTRQREFPGYDPAKDIDRYQKVVK